MSKHKVKIEKIFEHPISGNIDYKKLISALTHYGVEVNLTKKHHAKLIYKGEECSIPLPHREPVLAKETVVELRHFLEKVGLTPDNL